MTEGRGHALAFGRAVDVYERSRPGYPAAALDWVLPPGARRVADVGAGTGKLTRALVARGLEVTAVEPDDAMRAELGRRVPGARALAGRGESLPVPDAALDAVLFAQSWHWVDPAVAAPEVARTLAPGGRLGLLWNDRDLRTDWVARLDELMVAAGGSPDRGWRPAVPAPFGPLERTTVGWTHALPAEAVADLVASRSYVIVLPPAEREALLAQVRELVSTHPEVAGRDTIEIPYVTQCYRTSPVAAPAPSNS